MMYRVICVLSLLLGKFFNFRTISKRRTSSNLSLKIISYFYFFYITVSVRSSVPVVSKDRDEDLSVIQKLQQIADETIERISRVSGLRLRGNPISDSSTPASSNFIGCSSVKSCGDCITEIGCGWCESTATCISSSNEAPESCPRNAWRRASCSNICSSSFSCDSCVGDNPIAGRNVWFGAMMPLEMECALREDRVVRVRVGRRMPISAELAWTRSKMWACPYRV